jgi:hemolysin III
MYLAMGYMSLLAAAPLAAAVPASGLAWLVAGGIAYTAGAIIFSRGRPDPWPGLAGSGTTKSGICWFSSAAPATSRS